MNVFLFFLGIMQCVLLYFLARCGIALERRARREESLAGHAPRSGWPRVAMIVPLAGERPFMEPALTSLLGQDYPSLTPIFVTATEDDAAVGLIRRLQQNFPGIRHVVAGRAAQCGQKNYNLLAGVAAAPGADVLMFCDSTHVARPDFARCLVGPIARREASFCAGYHQVEPLDKGIFTVSYALSVLMMRLLQGMSALTQPWGGAMAMSREAFERHGVADLWASNVVDDCSLGAMLQREGEHVRFCPAALLKTPAREHGLSQWTAWMERQILFLKFCMRGQWILLGLFMLFMIAPCLWCGIACLRGILGLGGDTGPFLALLWLLCLAWALNRWRPFLVSPPPPGRWVSAFFMSLAVFCTVYLRTIGKSSLLWAGTLYRVGRGGRVVSIRRE